MEILTARGRNVTPEQLKQSYFQLKRQAATGVDGISWQDYQENLDDKIVNLHSRIHSGCYIPKPARRVWIPKSDGTQRPLSIQGLEDKIAQHAVVALLNQIYEVDFVGFSYGFRPNRSQHDALDALTYGISKRKVNWVLDLDLQKFFDTVEHEWLIRMIQHRVQDNRLITLIKRWIKVGVVDDQGQRVPAEDANNYLAMLTPRLNHFGLSVHPDKTRLIRFGRYAVSQSAERHQKRPDTFDFLGFTHYCTTRENGEFKVGRKTVRTRLIKQIKAVQDELRKRLHEAMGKTLKWIRAVLLGHMNYYSVPGNIQQINLFHQEVVNRWLKMLRRRSQRHRIIWVKFGPWVKRYLPKVQVMHPYPEMRFRAKYSK